MSPPAPRRRLPDSRYAAVLTLLALLLPASSNEAGLRALHDRIPGLTGEAARHLVFDDDEAFGDYAEKIGSRGLRELRQALTSTFEESPSPPELERRRRAARPYLDRVDHVLATAFDSPEYAAETRRRDAMSAEQNFRLQELFRRSALEASPDSIVPRQLARLEALRREFAALGYPRGMLLVELGLADVVMRRGGYEERRRWLELAVARARALGERTLLCQALGMLGDLEQVQGRGTPERRLEEVYAIATRSRIPEQRARALSFLGAWAEQRGEYARALDLARDAIRVCRETGGGGLEIRYVVRAMALFARLGCWELVDRLHARLAPLQRDLSRPERIAYRPFILEGATLGARARMRLGDSSGSQDIFRAAAGELKPDARRVAYAKLLQNWSAALHESDLHAEALTVAEEGLRYCDSLHVTEHGPELALRRAQLLATLGRKDDAGRALRDLRRGRHPGEASPPEIAVAGRALAAELALESGDVASAAALTRESLAAFAHYARGLDGGASSEMALAGLEHVRDVAHRVLGRDPVAGYRLEMEWRAMVADVGRDRSQRASYRPPRPMHPLPPAGVTHLLYRVERDAVVRWTAGARGIRRDRIALSRGACAALVQRALGRGPDGLHWSDAAPTPASQAAAELSRRLLPPDLMQLAGTSQRILISPDGPLSALVFESLPVDPGGGPSSLASVCDVAYLHSIEATAASPARATPVIIGDPQVPDVIRRRHPGSTSLPAARLEIARVAEIWRGAEVLAETAATRDAVLDAMGRASHIYLAAHLLRDPQVPLVRFIPLALPRGGAESESYLDPRHIRALDLSGCRLVVLSSCAGAAPYVASTGISRGIGDAFLDAGAVAVVHAAWPIRDDDAARFTSVFLEERERDPADVVGALNRARRRLLHDAPAGPWLAWSVGVRGWSAATAGAIRRLS